MAHKKTLSEEIMAEIILKLPVKTITQCKILSKQYYSLINSPFFIHRHLDLTRLTNKPHDEKSVISPIVTSARIFDRRGRAEESVISPIVTFAWDSEGHYIIHGPVDGLYCVIQPDNVFLRRSVTVWNISTRERYVLPELPLFYHKSQERWVLEMISKKVRFRKCLGFGFGYDVRTGDYKVVIICGFFPCWFGETKLDTSETRSLYVYNVSEGGEWRNHDGLGVDPSDIESCIGVFFRGACHWIYAGAGSTSGYSILALDMSIESSRTVPFPNVGDEMECYDMSIVVINECLALINGKEGEMEGSSLYFDVWVMAEYGDAQSWSILYRVSLPPMIFGRFVGIISNRFYVVEENRGLVSYDLESNEKERYPVVDVGIRWLLPYVESLVRINRSNL